ncbi:MAG TPA: translation elongation factor 4 [Candidatus Paceibacterota bacterium]|nr:translation elongation factor 4 [Candidatus Paceibacterota bacterium]
MNNIRNFCIIAHIDAGKSTLADRLLELTGTIEKRKMQDQMLDQMELERERGITIKLQPVRMKYKEYILNLIDTPGHVDFTYEVSRSLAAVEGAILLIDATKGVQAQTLANLTLAQKQKLTIIPVINKIDAPAARVPETEQAVAHLLNIDSGEIIKISAKTGENVDQVLRAVVEKVSPPKFSGENLDGQVPLQALIFDSTFDAYKGVIAFVRVFSGELKAGERIKLGAVGAQSETIEVGYFAPQLIKQPIIGAGEIGYIATGIKTPGLVKVGDTILKANESGSALSGYQEPEPMVFASFYPEDSDDFDELKDALAKLKLTDAALFFEPESSPALGRGFRLGFLGMLHIEIISERLKREFDLDLIISSPTVEYEVTNNKGEIEKIRSASQLPDPSFIKEIKEPVCRLDIIVPNQYLGGVMNLVSEIRNQYLSTEYLSKEIVQLTYQVPFAEIVSDFYDRLKSVSSGYASMSYSPSGYQVEDLVRLDILVASEPVEPFSKIVPRAQAVAIGRAIVAKLKEVVPKQLFAVILQAAIGGKIVAREDISAMRKDVTGYLYGGDITRKKKLLEKQKRGKERMKATGRVNIPQSVFLEMLKK